MTGPVRRERARKPVAGSDPEPAQGWTTARRIPAAP